ncbi:cytochrome P450 [Artomyces pyxidatus]|uniref:Cytochrome P450 n=1 Tax=Artomyces pyxidatus TaxID=48021 RepID=A0ACB8SL06_9AGAM|nr:cytochrome P450 [Artomyces pyxidatus]
MFDPLSGIKYRQHIWKTYGPISRFCGPLGDQTLLISDPKALTTILVKDRDIFEESDWYIELFRHANGPGLLSSTGALHRKQRKLLNPTFSAQRLRSMVPLLHELANQLIDAFHAKLGDGPQEVEVLDLYGRVALEMIAQTGLGYTFKSFQPDAAKNEFKQAIKEFMPVVAKLQMFLPLFPYISGLPPKLLRFGAACLPSADLHYIVKLTDITSAGMDRLFQAKKESLAREDLEQNDQLCQGKDIIHALMTDNANTSEEDKMQDDEIKAQMITLLAAATDTTSISLSRLSLVLSQHQDVQDRLRKELSEAVASSKGELGYDELLSLPYLDAVCRETWRLYAPVPFVTRTCRADTTVPLSRPIPGVTPPEMSFVVPRGTDIIVDILGANCDQNIWGLDADVWKPERWLSPLPDSVADAHIPGVYSNLMTFLAGSRACIGFKLAELQIKLVLSQLVRSFRFLPPKTEIIWRLAPVVTPSVNGSTAFTSRLPLVVERV